MAKFDVLHGLVEILRSAKAEPVISPERVAPSTIYDLRYRLCVIALTFESYAKADLFGSKRLQTARLKLLQFVAIRPWLIPVMREWMNTEANPQLSVFAPQKARRGFVGDAVHDRVVDYLVAHQVFERMPAHLALGENGEILKHLISDLENQGLFERERSALLELKSIKITNKMLEGW